MLKYLKIRDFALIRELEVEFSAGLVLLTGETGSGKSILVDAVSLLVGGRATQEMVRSGGSRAVIEGIFSLGTTSPAAEALAASGPPRWGKLRGCCDARGCLSESREFERPGVRVPPPP